MRELSIEEKAKAYDEALEKLRDLYRDYDTISCLIDVKEELANLFPELKESEDEKISKLCKELIESAFMNELCNKEERDTCIAWFEKQDNERKQLYVRFGDIPSNEKSKIYRGEKEIGDENGVSVYSAFELNGNIVLGLTLPITKTTLYTQQHLLEYDNRPCYLVSGDYVGKGTDGEPLIKNISVIKRLDNYRIKECEKKPAIEMKSAEESLGIDSETYNKIVDECIYGDDKQKSADKIELKFKVGDWVVSPNGVYWHIDAIQNGRYEVTADTGQCGNWPLDTNIYRLWTIQDAKDGNVLTNGDFPCIFKRCDDNGSLYVYCGINAHNDFSILSEDPENVWDDYSKQYFPATKEQRDLLFQKMKEAGYEWDSEKKELKKIEDEEYNGEDYGIDSLFHAQRILEKTLGSVDGYQTDDGILSHQCAITAVKKLYEQKPKRMISAEAKEAMYDKPDWSEKDENVLEDIEEAIINYWHGDTQDILLDWLKSLRPQNHWKPSDEQVKQLGWIAEQNKDNMIGKELISLYQDLKKLREG